jgi:hypothetical protein
MWIMSPLVLLSQSEGKGLRMDPPNQRSMQWRFNLSSKVDFVQAENILCHLAMLGEKEIGTTLRRYRVQPSGCGNHWCRRYHSGVC